jgi:hypothetical protein
MYIFKKLDPHEYEPAEARGDVEEMMRLEKVDKVLLNPDLQHLDWFQIRDASIIQLDEWLGESLVSQSRPARDPKPPRIKERQVARRMSTRPDVPQCVKHKATIWHQGRTVALGWFMSEQVRDEAVTMAKTMRQLGIPLEMIREAVQRMTR